MSLGHQGKNLLIAGLLVWALVATFAYWQIARTPRVLATQLGKSLLENTTHQSDFEKIEFLKYFIESYYSFDSKDYWQDQLQLTYLMNNDLATQRLQELKSINLKAKSSYLTQKADIITIEEIKPQVYEIYISVKTNMDKEQHSNTSKIILSTQNIDRTLDNPTGIEIVGLENSPLMENNSLRRTSVFLTPQKNTVLVFPCPILKIDLPKENLIQTKIINSDKSEVHLGILESIPQKLNLIFKCENKEFHLVAATDEQTHTYWLEITLDQALPIRKSKKIDKRYDRDIEKLLNVEIAN